jgi:hypothetical protein
VVQEPVKKEPPYPINALRNLAILGAEKRRHDGWIFVLDADAKVSGWGVYCCDFLLLPIASCCSQCPLLVVRRSIHT